MLGPSLHWSVEAIWLAWLDCPGTLHYVVIWQKHSVTLATLSLPSHCCTDEVATHIKCTSVFVYASFTVVCSRVCMCVFEVTKHQLCGSFSARRVCIHGVGIWAQRWPRASLAQVAVTSRSPPDHGRCHIGMDEGEAWACTKNYIIGNKDQNILYHNLVIYFWVSDTVWWHDKIRICHFKPSIYFCLTPLH